MVVLHRPPITGASTKGAILSTSNGRIVAQAKKRQLLRESPEVFITHKYREEDGRITHVRCWYVSEKELFKSDVFDSRDVIDMLKEGKREIYTAGLDVTEGEGFDFWLLHENGAEVLEKHFDYLTTEGVGAEYNNLGELAELDPKNPRDIKPTYANPPTKKRPWSDKPVTKQ